MMGRGVRVWVHLGLFFLLLGGLEGLIVRIQLMQPQMRWLPGEAFLGALNVHATTLVLLALVPLQLASGFALLHRRFEPAAWTVRTLGGGAWTFAIGALALHAVMGLGLVEDGLAGLPAPPWLGDPAAAGATPLRGASAAFAASVALLCLAHVLGSTALLGAALHGLRRGPRGLSALLVVAGLTWVPLFLAVVLGVAARLLGADLGLERPLWWAVFDHLELPRAWALVLPAPGLAAVALRRHPSVSGLFGAVALVMFAGAAVAGDTGPGYAAVLALHLVFMGALLFAVFAGLYEAWPELTGGQPRAAVVRVHFALVTLSVVAMLVALSSLGSNGAPRRLATVPVVPELEVAHLLASLAAFALGGAVLGGVMLGLWQAPRNSE